MVLTLFEKQMAENPDKKIYIFRFSCFSVVVVEVNCLPAGSAVFAICTTAELMQVKQCLMRRAVDLMMQPTKTEEMANVCRIPISYTSLYPNILIMYYGC